MESGGDNLAATFSPELADLTIYVIDVAEGEKIPRKGGPGITRSDLLVINKIDLAPLCRSWSLGVMEADTLRMRGKRPFVFSNLKSGDGVDPISPQTLISRKRRIGEDRCIGELRPEGSTPEFVEILLRGVECGFCRR